MSTSTLDGGFVGFCTTVAKEGLVGSRVGTQPVGQGGLFGNVIQIGHMVHLFHLVFDRVGQVFIVVSECASGDSRDAVQIVLAIGCL